MLRDINVKITLRKKKKSVASNLLFLTRKTAIRRRLIDIFETLIDRFHEKLISINCSDFSNMHSNIYSCLFHDANIKEENIIDSHAA